MNKKDIKLHSKRVGNTLTNIYCMMRPDKSKYFTCGNIQCENFKALEKFVAGQAEVNMDDMVEKKTVIVDGYLISYC